MKTSFNKNEMCECGHPRKAHSGDYLGNRPCIDCTCSDFRHKNPNFTTCKGCGAKDLCATAKTINFKGCERYDKNWKI